MQSNNTSGSVLYSPCDVPTIPGVRVCMDKTSVEYLLSKCSDQFICSLKNKATFILYSTKSQKLLPQSGLCCTDPTITSTWRQWEGKMYFNRKKPPAQSGSGRGNHLPQLVEGEKRWVTRGFRVSSAYIFQTQSLTFYFFHAVDFTAVAKLCCQHSLSIGEKK